MIYVRDDSGSDKSGKRKFQRKRHYLARVCVCVPCACAGGETIRTNIVNIRDEIRVENYGNERTFLPVVPDYRNPDFIISVFPRFFPLLFRKSRASFSIHRYPFLKSLSVIIVNILGISTIFFLSRIYT